MLDFTTYIGLFSAAFIAATIFPMQSEAILVGLILSNRFSVVLLVLVASVGNTMGAAVNWLLGRGVERYRDSRWFPLKRDKLERAQRWYHRYGKWSLLVSWIPVVGDAVTVAAGVMREPLPTFLVLVFIGKALRYTVLAAATLSMI
ncbi:DedA family protein [Rhizobium sp. NTR19]|uniref:DedA family protein n=1 Tax=Neorhizobium turbinariae TaxID=2937795 RepID=A0ABT0IT47_9HYPH|nr:YqaA family protein [Neorhizobium turbinariae]MCK8781025.1 DedA family protein [Neorhizobium turbinariae]